MANTTTLAMFLLSSMTIMAILADGRHIITTPTDSSPTTTATSSAWVKQQLMTNPEEEEKFYKLHFYIHDFVHGPNQTVYDVAESTITATSNSYFGRVQVVDHLITVGPEIDSEKVGRVQGVHVMADLNVAAISVNWNFLFNDGSTITVLGRLVAFAKEGVLTIVGGTGRFLMADGWAEKTTLTMDPVSFNSIMEYTMYVYSSAK